MESFFGRNLTFSSMQRYILTMTILRQFIGARYTIQSICQRHAEAMTSHAKLKLPKTLVLAGMMGAGKTSIGRRGAARLGVPFVDADDEIESAAGGSIEDIFERYGEAAFRDWRATGH